MEKYQDWFWEIKECGQGPHYYFNATFDQKNASCLAALILKHPLSGFVHCHTEGKLTSVPCRDPNNCGSYDLYIDESNYAGVLSGLKSDPPQITVSHYIWHIIYVCGNSFGIECGYGGITGTDNKADTSLIVKLAQSPELTLVNWTIMSGGDGYTTVYFRTGTSATELLAYLLLSEPQKPDFAQIERELCLALSEPALSETYRLGECKISGWQLQLVVLHEIQKTTNYGSSGWNMTPHTTQLEKVVKSVSDKCKVPGCVGGAAHDNNDFYTLIGSSISFGYSRR